MASSICIYTAEKYITVEDFIRATQYLEDSYKKYKVYLKFSNKLYPIDGISHLLKYKYKEGSDEREDLIMFLYQKGSYKALNDYFLNSKKDIRLDVIYNYLIMKNRAYKIIGNIEGETVKGRVNQIEVNSKKKKIIFCIEEN